MGLLSILDKLLPDRFIDKKTRKILLENFGVSGHYYPLYGDIKPVNMEYFDIDVFHEHFGTKKLVDILKLIGENQINEINESSDDLKINVDEIVIDNSETYYCNDNADWLIYCSHENTISIAGNIILDKLKEEWKEWESYHDTWETN